MANVNVTIRMDETLKKQANELFSDFGLSLNAALNKFVKQSVREQRIPFEITRNVPAKIWKTFQRNLSIRIWKHIRN